MLALPGYITTKQIHISQNSLIYRGVRKSDMKHVVVKILRSEHPSQQDLARFKHEYELLEGLHGEGTVTALGIENYQNGLAIIIEDFGTESLKQLLAEKRLSLKEFLILAIHITEALEKIHQNHITHKDINPANILIDVKTQETKIIDFGIASILTREMPEMSNPHLLEEGTLYYSSPEQTGRTNRGIDYRTDYYSLGITLYQMITGQLPFKSDDISELVHMHIAKLPKPPHEIDRKVPQVISDIIMKLLAKTAEERYQSTFGLKIDLQNCLDQLKLKGEITPFKIGAKDLSSQLQIPEKLYGREEEHSRLLHEFELASQGHARLVLIEGYPGVGKTSLVHEIYKPLVEKRGYFVAGKFDQYKRNTPYAALIDAIQSLIQQILMESEQQIKIWRRRIQDALGPNGQVMIDIIPMLKLIIGQQPSVAKLEPSEEQNRFNFVFINLIHALSSSEHAAVMFLDDCQWADLPTLKLLENILLNPDSNHLLIIGAYRDSEIYKDHILQISLNLLKKSNFNYEVLTLKPLKLRDVTKLIADALHYDVHTAQPLAELCYNKTEGNPFFLNQFLKELHKEQLLEFDLERGSWRWDLQKIEEKDVTNNVVEFMVKKIEKLPDVTQTVLQIASCLGNHFDLSVLRKIYEKSPKETADALWKAVEAGLIIPTNDDYQFVTDEKDNNASYRFLHDRIQQAAYSLIPEEKRDSLHFKIGRTLLKSLPKETINESVMDIVNQINQGLQLLTDEHEKISIAKLNLLAGRKAMSSIAYEAALHYFKTGIFLLGKDCWKLNYDLTLELYLSAVKAATYAPNFQEMKEFNQCVIDNAKDLLPKLKIYENQIEHMTGQSKIVEAIDMGISTLKLLGISIPAKPNNFHIALGLIRIKWLLANKSMDELYNLPQMTDPYHKAAVKLLAILFEASFLGNPKLIPLLTFEIIKLSLKYGNDELSLSGYSFYGVILTSMGNFKTAKQYGELSLRLLDKYHIQTYRSNIMLTVCAFIMHMHEHYNAVTNKLLEIFQIAVDTGYVPIACYTGLNYCYDSLMTGKELTSLAKEMEYYSSFSLKSGHAHSSQFIVIYLQSVFNLIGDTTSETTRLIGTAFDETVLTESTYQNDKLVLLTIYLSKLMLGCYFQDYKLAYENYLLYKNLGGLGATLTITECSFAFYSSLACLGYYPTAKKSEQPNLLKIAKSNLKKIKIWSKSVPVNFLHKDYLIEAELAAIDGDFTKAVNYFDQAIDFAKQNHYVHDEALANELAAKFYLVQNKEKIAKIYMTDAYYCYLKWGAAHKARLIEQQYAQLIKMEQKSFEYNLLPSTFTSHDVTTHTVTDIVDLAAVIKATQALSKEIVLEKLLKKMMRIVIENAGAQKGFLLLEKSGELLIEAESTIDSDKVKVKVLQSSPIQDKLPVSIIQYVTRSHEPLIIDNLMTDERFNKDIYTSKTQSKSVLCIPLLNKGELSGILYLENNLTLGAFTQGQLELMNLLSGQVVVSIDNARLYTQTKELKESYERFVPHQFISLLEKKSVTDVKLGDEIQKDMAVMFCDIRDFTSISEKMTPQESMNFINLFLRHMEPIITKYNGFIDKYIGDAIMALFPSLADDALQCAVAMLHELNRYNEERIDHNEIPIHVGIGINSGLLMLGTVGAEHRIEGTVISDAVNSAARVQELTKVYHVPLLITEEIYFKITNIQSYAIRKIDTAMLKGKSKPVTIYEVFDNDPEPQIILKQQTLQEFEEGVELFQEKKFTKALLIFERIAKINPNDLPIVSYIKRCKRKLESSKDRALLKQNVLDSSTKTD